jgi:hypothetical protein
MRESHPFDSIRCGFAAMAALGGRPPIDFTTWAPLDYNDGEMTRRTFLTAVLGLSALLVGRRAFGEDDGTAEPIQTIHRSEDEWRKLLTPEQFRVLREEGTERRFCPLDQMTDPLLT